MKTVKKQISKSAINKTKKSTNSKNRFRLVKRRKLGFQERDASPSFTATRSRKENIIQEQNKENSPSVIDLSSSDEEGEESPENKSNPLILNHERICLYKNDLNCLKEKEWLKDNVVDLALAELRSKHEKAGQTYLFNSLFFSKLRSIRDADTSKKDYYTTTKRWFKNEELSKKRFWIIPVCDRYHWYVIVVAHPRSNKPTIMVLDSMKKKEYKSVDLVKAFLKQKYASEHTGRCRRIVVGIANIPQQTNASDCGLFAIRSANLFLRNDAQNFYRFIKDPKKHEAPISNFYDETPVPTRQTVLTSILMLIKKR